MIEVNAEIEEIEEEDVEYTLKRYYIHSDYPLTVMKVLIDGLENQITTDEDGNAIISMSNTDEHSVEIMIENEHFKDEL